MHSGLEMKWLITVKYKYILNNVINYEYKENNILAVSSMKMGKREKLESINTVSLHSIWRRIFTRAGFG